MKTALITCIFFLCHSAYAQGIDSIWTQYPIKPDDMEFLDEKNWILLGQHDTTTIGPYYLLRTTDGGKIWEKLVLPFTPDGIAFPHKSTLYASGEGSVYISRDMGDNWDHIVSSVGEMVSFPDRKHGFTTLAKSIDSGKSWESLPLPDLPSQGSLAEINFGFQDSLTGFLALTRREHQAFSHVFFTSDGGQSWGKFLNSDNTNFARSILFVDNQNWLLSFTWQGSLRSTDSGKTWGAESGYLGCEAAKSIAGEIFGAAGYYSKDSGKTTRKWNHGKSYIYNLVRTLSDSTAFISTPVSHEWPVGALILRINSPSLAFAPKSDVKPIENKDDVSVSYDVASMSLSIGGFTSTTLLEIYDILGRKLGSVTVDPNQSSQTIALPFAGQPLFYSSSLGRGRVQVIRR